MAAGDAVWQEGYSIGQRSVETWLVYSNAAAAIQFTCRHLVGISHVDVQEEESGGVATGNNATHFVSWDHATVTITGHAGLTTNKKLRVRIEGW